MEVISATCPALPTAKDGGSFYSINFTQPFKTSQNASEILKSVDKTAGAANNLAPNYFDGFMFANDDELYLYGGLLRDTDSLRPPAADAVLGYERFQYGPERESWEPGFYNGQLSEGVTRYITAGAGVNVPSENLGFYFSGMQRRDGGDIRSGGRPQYNATTVATSLITVDLSTMREEKWTNDTLDKDIPGRANAEIVWIPTVDQGILVAVGGVVNPEWEFLIPSKSALSNNDKTSPTFMETVSIYDIKAKKWYQQDTSGATPPALTQFCAVVATASDKSSHNIYIYGGYDGLNETSNPSDDVYVLSLPSFIWVKAKAGSETHGRRMHKCAKIYPDQMIVVGGQAVQNEDFNCLDGGLIQIFNLNTLEWQDSYDPDVWSEYKVPGVISAEIGGDADGGAKNVEPSKWDDKALPDLFKNTYTKTIPTYYPYPSIAASATGEPNPTRISTAVPEPAPSGGSRVPDWVPPVLGTVFGIAFVCAMLVGILFWRKRQYERKFPEAASEAGTSSFNRNRVVTWIQGSPPSRSHTVTSVLDDRAASSAGTAVGSQRTDEHQKIEEATEIAGSPVLVELADTSPALELPSTMEQIGFSATPLAHPRPRNLSSSPHASDRGAGVPRAESPTTSLVAGHVRSVSSLESKEVAISTSEKASNDDDSTGIDSDLDPSEDISGINDNDVLSPVSPEGSGPGFATLHQTLHTTRGVDDGDESPVLPTTTTTLGASTSRRRSNFDERLDD
ncbi:MAG: hypothetical protein M1825_003589 [Sarcosagium campestre]|nr:MAG: hypothetical protein M1825_003589 [Sarcosagium campestre]